MSPHDQFTYKDGVWWDEWNHCEAEALPWDGDPLHELVLPICKCGNPDRLVELLAWYLDCVTVTVGPLPQGRLDIDDDRYLMLAYMADMLDFTDHGGSVYGAWPTEAGLAWRQLVKEGK